MNFETFVVTRYLKSPRKDRSISIITKISILGVAVGVMSLIVVLSVMNGFERDLRGALQGASGHLTIYTFAADGIHTLEQTPLEQDIKDNLKVIAMAPFISQQGLIMGRQKPKGTLVKGIDYKKESEVTQMDHFIRSKLFDIKRDNSSNDKSLKEKEKNEVLLIMERLKPHSLEIKDKSGQLKKITASGIIIGSQLAKNLGVEINDFVTLVTPEERITPMGNMPRAKRFIVVGFFESGLMGFDEILSYIDIKEAQKIYRMQNRISGISIKIEDPENADVAKEILKEKIGFPYIVISWIEQNKNLFAVFRLEKLGLAIILNLIILIASFNIISSLIMLVIEKNKDIAILKAIGATNKSIRNIFIIQGSIIGLTGTIIGEILGIGLCWIIASFDIIDIPPGVYVSNRIPMYIEIWQITLIAVISFLICFFVTIYPSQKAAKLDPIESIRND